MQVSTKEILQEMLKAVVITVTKEAKLIKTEVVSVTVLNRVLFSNIQLRSSNQLSQITINLVIKIEILMVTATLQPKLLDHNLLKVKFKLIQHNKILTLMCKINHKLKLHSNKITQTTINTISSIMQHKPKLQACQLKIILTSITVKTLHMLNTTINISTELVTILQQVNNMKLKGLLRSRARLNESTLQLGSKGLKQLKRARLDIKKVKW